MVHRSAPSKNDQYASDQITIVDSMHVVVSLKLVSPAFLRRDYFLTSLSPALHRLPIVLSPLFYHIFGLCWHVTLHHNMTHCVVDSDFHNPEAGNSTRNDR